MRPITLHAVAIHIHISTVLRHQFAGQIINVDLGSTTSVKLPQLPQHRLIPFGYTIHYYRTVVLLHLTIIRRNKTCKRYCDYSAKSKTVECICTIRSFNAAKVSRVSRYNVLWSRLHAKKEIITKLSGSTDLQAAKDKHLTVNQT